MSSTLGIVTSILCRHDGISTFRSHFSQVDPDMNDWKPRMQKTVRHLAEQLAGIRTGTITMGFIETVRLDCQGSSAPIRHIGVIKQQGVRILVTPFDKADVPAVVRSLTEARLNAYALNPATVSVSVPPVSREQRGESPGTSRSWARTPDRRPGDPADARKQIEPRDGDRNAVFRKRPMRRFPRSTSS